MAATPSFLDWPGASAEWARTLTAAVRTATTTWSQPILPGWTFNLNSNNSGAPQTEVEVLQKYSYGRQLGRISDALEALIALRVPKEQQAGPAYQPFLTMAKDITAMKKAAALHRVAAIEADLRVLQTEQPAEYERLRQSLRRLLDL